MLNPSTERYRSRLRKCDMKPTRVRIFRIVCFHAVGKQRRIGIVVHKLDAIIIFGKLKLTFNGKDRQVTKKIFSLVRRLGRKYRRGLFKLFVVVVHFIPHLSSATSKKTIVVCIYRLYHTKGKITIRYHQNSRQKRLLSFLRFGEGIVDLSTTIVIIQQIC